jgi:hypothetical protein
LVYDAGRSLDSLPIPISLGAEENPMDVAAATADYEAWLAKFCPLNAPDLAHKHSQMGAADPFPFFRGTHYRVDGGWVVRRLAPQCSRIELDHLAKVDAGRVLNAMGAETANVHLGTPAAGAEILKDLAHRKPEWLEESARTMTDAVERDWQAWRAARPPDKT